MKVKFGELTEGMDAQSHTMIIYTTLDLVRRILLAFVVVFATQVLWLQILVTTLSCLAMIVTIGYTKARLTNFDRRMDLFNEIKMLIITYHIMLFSPFVPDIPTQWKIGYSCSATLIIGILVNSTMVIVAPIRLLKRSCQVRYAKKKAKKQIAKRKRNSRAMMVNGYISRRR